MNHTEGGREKGRGERGGFREDVVAGLSAPRKALSPKWLYDARGSALYEMICELPEYYQARTELAILEAHASDIARAVGHRALVFEYGSGNGKKTERFLAALEEPVAYLPVDISQEALIPAVAALRVRFPEIEIRPVVGDFTDGVRLPDVGLDCARRISFFPGSTIGNFDPPDAVAVLRRMAREAGPGGGLLVGLDLPKDVGILKRAYDDQAGVTAAFDLNLLTRMNRELGGDFRLSAFRHRAVWNERLSRVEMHLESTADQVVHVAGIPVLFRAGETIHTESAYKWEPRAFDALADLAGWRPEQSWSDSRAWFTMRLYTRS